jgi:hypothetical protein
MAPLLGLLTIYVSVHCSGNESTAEQPLLSLAVHDAARLRAVDSAALSGRLGQVANVVAANACELIILRYLPI